MDWQANSNAWRSVSAFWIPSSAPALTGSECGQAGAAWNSAVATDRSRRLWLSAWHPLATWSRADIDLTYIVDLQMPGLEVRRIDILQDAIEEGSYDFVVARALLHHLTPAGEALERMVTALNPGGVLLSIEPDMLPCTVTEPDSMRNFWQQWLKWSVEAGIDSLSAGKFPRGWICSD